MDKATLYNCQTDHAEPDWKQFDAIEVHPCRSFCECGDEDCENGSECGNPEAGTFTEQVDAEEAQFWTVYGHYAKASGQMGLDAITDCPTEDAAKKVGAILDAKIKAALWAENDARLASVQPS